MARQTGRGKRAWTAIGGLAGLLTIIGLIIAYLQLNQAERASDSSDTTQATVLAIMNQQLAVQREIATAQAIPAQTGSTATVISERIAQLTGTQEALEVARTHLETTQTALVSSNPNTNTSVSQPQVTSSTISTPPPVEGDTTTKPGQVPTLVQCPEKIDFGIAIQCSIDKATEIDRYTFDAQADDHILLRMTRISETVQPWIRVFAPDKTQICEGYAERLVDIFDCPLPRSGTYSIQVADSSRDRKEIGTYTLYTQRLNNPGTVFPINFGQAASGSIGRITQIDTYSFEANVDDRIFIRMLRTSETVQPWIRIYAPDGKLACEVYNERFIEKIDCVIPRTGQYTVLVSDSSKTRTEIGTYSLYFQRLNNPGKGIPISFTESVSGTITSPTEVHTYAFVGKADEKLIVKMNRASETIQPWVRVYSPTGILACEGYNERQIEISCVLPRSGTYTMLVADSSQARTETGAYSLSIRYP